MFESLYLNLNETSCVLITLSVIMLTAFLSTRLMKLLRLPEVSGYIVTGILIGPCALKLVCPTVLEHMSFVSDLALAFIAFGVGRFFKLESLRKGSGRAVIITLTESLLAGALITIVMYFALGLDFKISLVLGAIATATAPASTMMTIRQFKAKGEFVDTLLKVVALDDAVCLIAFSVSAAIAADGSGGTVNTVVLPVVYNIAALAAGFAGGLLLKALCRLTSSRGKRLMIVLALLTGISGLCSIVDVSPLLSCMVLGTVYVNFAKEEKLFDNVDRFTPPLYAAFFILSGTNLDVKLLASLGVVGVVYFFVRILGKYLGAAGGAAVTRSQPAVRKYLGLALVPQAGVAVGLAVLADRILGGSDGELVMTIILASSVLYELAGPILARIALFRSGSVAPENLPGKLFARKSARITSCNLPALYTEPEQLFRLPDPSAERGQTGVGTEPVASGQTVMTKV